MLYVIHAKDRTDGKSAEIRKTYLQDHLDYLKSFLGVIVVGGALLDEDGQTRVGSVFVMNVPNKAAADQFAAGEPFRKAGLYEEYRISRMRRAQWNPAAAPSTPDGN